MEKKTQKERIQELTERLEKGVKEVFESGAYENMGYNFNDYD